MSVRKLAVIGSQAASLTRQAGCQPATKAPIRQAGSLPAESAKLADILVAIAQQCETSCSR